ncbi:MAG: ferritin-like domain-containing protein [Myxococcales bacterium]|nr:ferritin-like domain-containing protein [Myxococcales bacterium]
MEYRQHNPLPLPKGEAYQRVEATLTSIFDWEYGLKQSKLLRLYEKGKSLSWNATEIDWTIDVDLERMAHTQGIPSFIQHALKPPRALSDEEAVAMHLHTQAFTLSQFLHGEQGAMLTAAKLVQAVPSTEAKFYAANQTADEARHVEVYHRYLTEKIGTSYEVHPSLRTLLDEIISAREWDMTFLGMQIMVEGLALAAFGVIRLLLAGEPLICDITARVMADEARHVAFGVLALEQLYRQELSARELREREDFIIEATHLLYARLLPTPAFERLGWDLKVWEPWVQQTPMQVGFRQMMFSKIVPNLKRLGLLTPRVRATFASLDLLRFEHSPDSVVDPGVSPPAELVALLMAQLGGDAPGFAPPLPAS